ncbi:MAG: MerR family transcriptional regulator [Burkholderiaceae bacterium]
MTDPEIPPPATHTISAVERDTGLGKDTLRVWERRYGFPQPQRDSNGDRVYPLDQVNKLRLLKRLIDSGHRPGKVVHLEFDELQALADSSAGAEKTKGAATDHAELMPLLEMCMAHRIEELRRSLAHALVRVGLQAFVEDMIAPLTEMVGELWARGQIAIHEEHLYTEVVQGLLRGAIAPILQHRAQDDVRPRVLLTTFPQEQHGLGLLMAEAMFALEGAYCISLGVQTPVIEIVQAASAQRADIVALSFSAAMPPKQAIDGLAELAGKLPAAVEIWAGGGCFILVRRLELPVRVLALSEVAPALAAWRQRHLA